MISLFKHSQHLLTNSSLKSIASFLPKMSRNTRSLRSKTLVKTDLDISDNKEPQNSIQTSKYFENKQIKVELTANNKVEEGTKNVKAIKLKQGYQKIVKQEANASTKTRKVQAQKTVVKTEPNDLERVKTEVLSDDDFIPMSTNSTLEVQEEVKQESIKTRKKQSRKTVIKTEPIESETVKTEVLSNEDFIHTNSTSEPQKGVGQISAKTRKKPSLKTVIKTEPIVFERIKTEVLSDEDFMNTNSQSEPQKGVGQISTKTRKRQAMPKVPDIVQTEDLNNDPQKMAAEKVSPQKRKLVEKVARVKKERVQDIEDFGWEPENWREVLDNILQMRKLHVAPVDSLGCEECPEKGVLPEVFRYQTLISVMLSSQTRDEVTYAATQRLITHGLTVDSILETSDEKIGELIYPAGFWKSKVKYIRNTTQILKDQYGGDIPRTFQDLCKLPGVGPKMANIVMSVGWNDTVGIAVDTHVHRISNRLGWLPKPTKDPEHTRKALESWMPKALWKDVTLHLVGFGQTLCKPLKPKCQDCLNCRLCPSSTVKL